MVDTILGGVVIAVISGVLGKSLGANNSVKNSICTERQISCQKLITEKIDNLGEKVDSLTKAVNHKLLGI